MQLMRPDTYWLEHVGVLPITRKYRDSLCCILLPLRYGMCHFRGVCTLTRPHLTVIRCTKYLSMATITGYFKLSDHQTGRCLSSSSNDATLGDSENEFSGESDKISGKSSCRHSDSGLSPPLILFLLGRTRGLLRVSSRSACFSQGGVVH